ncbi:unnamed protein product, partial [Rotaria magnacalcarata]
MIKMALIDLLEM